MKNSTCKFGSLIMCILFYVQKYFSSIGNNVWEQDKPLIRKISEYKNQLEENFKNFMNTYFEEFK